MTAPEHPSAVIHFTGDMTAEQAAILQARFEETAARARTHATQPPAAPVLLAACEAMAMLIRDEYGEGPITRAVCTFTQATPEQVGAVEQVESWWAATGRTAA